jgi:hypothetical protein
LGIENEFEDEEADNNPQSQHKKEDSPIKPPNKHYGNLIEGQQIIDDRLNHLRKLQQLESRKSDESSNFGEVLERRNVENIGSPKHHHYKSNKTLKQTIKK